MKMDSVYRRTMDAVRPAPERRDAMLQAILNHKAKPAARRRWALGAVTAAVVVLAMALARGGGAFGPQVAAPDVVTKGVRTSTGNATTDTTVKALPTPMFGADPVQRLTRLTLASQEVGKSLPTRIALLRSTAESLTYAQVEGIRQKLVDTQWTSIDIEYEGIGTYQIIAQRKSAMLVPNLEETFIADSGLLELLSAVGMPVKKQSDYEEPLRYTAEIQGHPAPGFLQLTLERSTGQVIANLRLVKNELMGTVETMPLEQAVKQAFRFVADGAQAENQPQTVQSVALAYFGGLPVYALGTDSTHGAIVDFFISKEGLAAFAYAPAITQEVLDAYPDMAELYRRFLAGSNLELFSLVSESRPMEGQRTWPLALPQTEDEKTQALTNLSLFAEQTGANLPKRAALVRTEAFEITVEQLGDVLDRLEQRGWSELAVTSRGVMGFTLRTRGMGQDFHIKNEKEQTQLAQQFMIDSGLPKLLNDQGMQLEAEPAFTQTHKVLYRVRLEGQQVPGYVLLSLEKDKTVAECTVYTVRSRLLGSVDTMAIDQAMHNAFFFPSEGQNLDWAQASTVTNAKVVFYKGVPLYRMLAPLPQYKGVIEAFSLAVPYEKLQAWPELVENFRFFRSGSGEDTVREQWPAVYAWPPGVALCPTE